jgi:hypothetical protein
MKLQRCTTEWKIQEPKVMYLILKHSKLQKFKVIIIYIPKIKILNIWGDSYLKVIWYIWLTSPSNIAYDSYMYIRLPTRFGH